ncbi:hypothetical protein B0H17DRAFT_479748 [Mycena rosella]|uniref:Uncharacterized protein n=1 Tax=Mycena rosella TaxID=1033263 RepID=A0AAD7DKX7_MYCRO|nr:hypothetical protein B0H17DRAFT_479748 [Mycena rosella]
MSALVELSAWPQVAAPSFILFFTALHLEGSDSLAGTDTKEMWCADGSSNPSASVGNLPTYGCDTETNKYVDEMIKLFSSSRG